MQIIEVLVEHAIQKLNRPFSYIYKGNKKVDVGFRVPIDFHGQNLIGYVTKVYSTDKTKEQLEEELGFAFDEIKDVIDDTKILNDDLMSLADQVTDYYLAPKIGVYQSMLPASLSPRSSSLHGAKIAYDKYLVCVDDNEEGLTPKQIEILRYIAQEGEILKREIKSTVVDKLIETNHLKIIFKEKRRLSLPDFEYKEPPMLTEDQQSVVDEFNDSEDMVYLLQGITGSGKTEVYLKLTEQMIKEGKSVLMLVPEISLTPMMVEYFLRRFKDNVAVLHSELTPGEKYDEYRKIAKGECKIVVGARSAIFAPLLNIGLIILDEEHTETYKQDTTPYYHAREVAIMRAKMHGAKVILGSATPCFETRARAQKGVYHLLKLTKRINDQSLPATEIVDMTDYHNIDKDSYMFSKQLRAALKGVLDRGEQAILLINRRGFSTNVSCRKCGSVIKCPNCGIALTYHKNDNMLKCHHCDHVEMMPETCPECGSQYLTKTGFGTERIEAEIHKLFPNARTLRLDSDAAKVRTKVASVVESFRKQEADILIGTQMIAKGHDFPNVTLVGIVLADIGLNMPSYRSSERAFQLITQAIGRAGRADKTGNAIIQTYMPTHYSIIFGSRQDYDSFYVQEMNMRKLQNYPPYSYLASIVVTGTNLEKVEDESYAIVDYLQNQYGEKGKVIGPATPYICYEGKKHIKTVLIKYKDIELTARILDRLLKIFASKNGIGVSINIDPYNF